MTKGIKRYILPALLLLLLVAAAANTAFKFNPSVAHAQGSDASCLAFASNLAQGSKDAAANDNAVTQLQAFLHANGFMPAAPSGYFGAATLAAVKNLQSSVNLPAVGSVGPLTRAFLQKITCASPAPATAPLNAPSTPSLIITPAAGTSTASTTATAASSTAATSTSTGQTLPYSSQDFTKWQAAWGSASTTSTGTLHLEGSLQNNGAEALFPASMGWSNYRYQANLSVANGNASLIARYVDANNFISCSFAKNWVEIDQVYNGSSTILVSKSVDGILSGTDGLTKTTSLAMDVNGNKIGCAGYGPEDNITYTLPNGSPLKGGIGIESWYGTPLADKLDLMSVSVDPL